MKPNLTKNLSTGSGRKEKAVKFMESLEKYLEELKMEDKQSDIQGEKIFYFFHLP